MDQPTPDEPIESPSSVVPPPRGVWALWAIIALIALMAVALFVFTFSGSDIHIGIPKREPIPVIKELPDFSLIERSGKTVTLADLRGGIWVADFIFTRCGGTCPRMTKNMSLVQTSISKMGSVYPPIRLVSFTVDPEWDTPEVLRRYAEVYGADGERWLFLTGENDQIQKLAREGFMLGVDSGGSEEEPIIHSERFVLIDAKGRIRGYYNGTEAEEVTRLLADINRLTREK